VTALVALQRRASSGPENESIRAGLGGPLLDPDEALRLLPAQEIPCDRGMTPTQQPLPTGRTRPAIPRISTIPRTGSTPIASFANAIASLGPLG
jgi:hypothetical protein